MTTVEDSLSKNAHTPGRRKGLIPARLLAGVIVLICAEVFSGASLGAGLWHPMTLLLTYWLYFAHFFFFTTLAARTARTSLSSLYLWGVLFGLYESWITKVIWHGYSGEGMPVMGRIGPYGYAEICMVFLFHPVMSFIVPLAVLSALSPGVRRLFPDLAWLTDRSRWARLAQLCVVLSLSPVMAMNSGGALNLAANLAVAVAAILLFKRLGHDALARDGERVVVFGRRGFALLCAYLVLLYGLTYPLLLPQGLPPAAVQLATFVFYALAIAGLALHRRNEPPAHDAASPTENEQRRIIRLFAAMIALALIIRVLDAVPAVAPWIWLNFVVWTPLGFVFMFLALWRSVQERRREPLSRPS